MRLHAHYDVTFPYFDKFRLIEAHGHPWYDDVRTDVMYERRRLSGFHSHKQHLRKRFVFRKAFHGIVRYAYYCKQFIR